MSFDHQRLLRQRHILSCPMSIHKHEEEYQPVEIYGIKIKGSEFLKSCPIDRQLCLIKRVAKLIGHF